MTRRKTKFEPHVRLYRHELQSEAYQSLSPEARALLIEFRALYRGEENQVFMGVREMMKRVGIGQRRAEHARDELLDRGFIRMTKVGSFSRKRRHATEYALTNEPMENKNGATAPKDFMRWRQKNTVAVATIDGSRSEYREKLRTPRKQSHGSRGEYRQGQNERSHGSRSDYTDRLPPHTGTKKWIPQEMGWRSKQGLLLNTCCLVCGVWTTSDRREFDDARHSCDEVSKAAYRARCKKLEAA